MRYRNADFLTVAPVTAAMLGINLALYAYCAVASGDFSHINGDVLATLGMSMRERLWQGDWFRLVMPMFLHGGFMHILFNTIALYQYGPETEVEFGHSNFATIYLLSGVGGIAFSQIFGGEHSIGASTSLFGILGALFSLTILRVPVLKYAWRSSTVRTQAVWIAIFFAFGLTGMMGNVDNWGHFGGFVFGVLLGGLFESWRQHRQLAVPFLAATVLVIGGFVCAARWSVFNPYYHLHMAALAGDSGNAALEKQEFAKAREWSKLWRNQSEIDWLILQYNQSKWNAAVADEYGYKFIPYVIESDDSE